MYDLQMGECCVGNVNVSKKGLYYHISCTCRPPDKELYRVIMRNESAEKDLGICVPAGNVFTLFTRVPIKYFHGDSFAFELVRAAKREFIVFDNTRFSYLDKLQSARLQHTNGQTIIVIDSVPTPQDSDQTPESPSR